MKISWTTVIIPTEEKKYTADRKRRNKIDIEKHTLQVSFRNVMEEVTIDQ